jgi:hypothetical protein
VLIYLYVLQHFLAISSPLFSQSGKFFNSNIVPFRHIFRLLPEVVATSHMWLFKYKLKLKKMKNSVPHLCWSPSKYSETTCGTDWKQKYKTVSLIVESYIGSGCNSVVELTQHRLRKALGFNLYHQTQNKPTQKVVLDNALREFPFDCFFVVYICQMAFPIFSFLFRIFFFVSFSMVMIDALKSLANSNMKVVLGLASIDYFFS